MRSPDDEKIANDWTMMFSPTGTVPQPRSAFIHNYRSRYHSRGPRIIIHHEPTTAPTTTAPTTTAPTTTAPTKPATFPSKMVNWVVNADIPEDVKDETLKGILTSGKTDNSGLIPKLEEKQLVRQDMREEIRFGLKESSIWQRVQKQIRETEGDDLSFEELERRTFIAFHRACF